MSWLTAFFKLLSTTRKQIKGQHTPRPKDMHFTNNFYILAKSRGLSERDARDVYYHGSLVKPNMLVRRYNGCELGIYFFNDHLTGQPIISSIWKRARR